MTGDCRWHVYGAVPMRNGVVFTYLAIPAGSDAYRTQEEGETRGE